MLRRNLPVILLIIVVTLLIFFIFRYPTEDRKTAFLSAIAGTLAVISGIGITAFFVVAQIYSPYYSGLKPLITRPTLVFLGAIGIGILLPLGILHGSSWKWFTWEPITFLYIFEISWTHLCFAWFAACLIIFPWYLHYAQKLVGPRGIITKAEASLSGPANRWDFELVDEYLRTLHQVALTALERREIAVLHLAFESLGNTLLFADISYNNTAQLEGRTNVILHDTSILPPAHQNDPWRHTYRQFRLLHIAIRESNSSHLILEECSCLGKLCQKALKDKNSSVICMAIISLLADDLSQGVVLRQPELVMMATTEIECIAREAIKLSIHQTARQLETRRYLFKSAQFAIRKIKDAFISESEGFRLSDDNIKSKWGFTIKRVLTSLRHIPLAALDEVLISSKGEKPIEKYKKLKLQLQKEDRLTNSYLPSITSDSIKTLSILGRQLNKANLQLQVKEAIFSVSHMGILAACQGWPSAAAIAIANLEVFAHETIIDDIETCRNSFNSLKRIGITAAVNNFVPIVLRALTALIRISRRAIENNLEGIALEIIGMKNSVVTILGLCRHTLESPTSLVTQKKSCIIKENLKWIIDNSTTYFNLQLKAKQALHEMQTWIP